MKNVIKFTIFVLFFFSSIASAVSIVSGPTFSKIVMDDSYYDMHYSVGLRFEKKLSQKISLIHEYLLTTKGGFLNNKTIFLNNFSESYISDIYCKIRCIEIPLLLKYHIHSGFNMLGGLGFNLGVSDASEINEIGEMSILYQDSESLEYDFGTNFDTEFYSTDNSSIDLDIGVSFENEFCGCEFLAIYNLLGRLETISGLNIAEKVLCFKINFILKR